MASNPKGERLLKIAYNALAIAGLLGVLWGMGIWSDYAENLPRSPNPATGNIYPLSIHGLVVYQTLRERRLLDNWDHWSWGIAIFGFVLAMIHEWRWGERRRK